MPFRKRFLLIAVYLLATIQFVWCYLWLTRPYVNTALYERGQERMPFQGRCLMMLPMRWAHGSTFLHFVSRFFAHSVFWFPRPVQPEVLVQAAVDVFCLAATGWFTTAIYKASSRRGLLTPFVYPLLLVACAATYVMHTVQNFRFIYDLPSLAAFSAAMYLLYFRRHWSLFVALFLIATLNRETTLLLLPLYLMSHSDGKGLSRWKHALRPGPLTLVSCLAVFWVAWQILIRSFFQHNVSEFYPRFDWNVKSILVPQAWPQLLSACGYLLLFVVVMRSRIGDERLRAWLWLVPIWLAFMFSFGILIETRVFGELIPYVVCATTLIAEEIIVMRMPKPVAVSHVKSERRSQTVSNAA